MFIADKVFLSSIHLIFTIFSIVEQVSIVCPLGPGQAIKGKFEPFGHRVELIEWSQGKLSEV